VGNVVLCLIEGAIVRTSVSVSRHVGQNSVGNIEVLPEVGILFVVVVFGFTEDEWRWCSRDVYLNTSSLCTT